MKIAFYIFIVKNEQSLVTSKNDVFKELRKIFCEVEVHANRKQIQLHHLETTHV